MRVIWVIGVSATFARLPYKFRALKSQLPEEALQGPFGSRLSRALHWHIKHPNLHWGRIVYLLARARFHPRVRAALGVVWLDADDVQKPYVRVYEKLVYRGICYYAPVLGRLFLHWYIKEPGRLFLTLESYQEAFRQEDPR